MLSEKGKKKFIMFIGSSFIVLATLTVLIIALIKEYYLWVILIAFILWAISLGVYYKIIAEKHISLTFRFG